MAQDFFDTPIEYLKGVGPKKAEILQKELRIFTCEGLIRHYPFRYVDRSKFYKVREVNESLPYVQLRGFITNLQTIGEKRSQRMTATFRDETGILELVWFKGINWVKKSLEANKEYIIFGKPTEFNGRINIVHPELEAANEFSDTMSAMQPVYNSSEKMKLHFLDSKGISKIQKTIVSQLPSVINETLPDKLIVDVKLGGLRETLINIHQPSNPDSLKKAEFRLKFEELFYLQLELLKMKVHRKEVNKGVLFPKIGEYFNSFYQQKLPFDLTNAQKRVLKEIRADMGTGKQMNRLLQGDVGSGKTLVALMSMLIALDNGYQACLMAPTELLVTQHFATLNKMLEGLGIKIALLTGSNKTKKRREILEQLISGEIHIVVGTHALIEESVQFKNLGLVVIDEQHRFGVEQRSRLWHKSDVFPHVMVMTATPIPRTLAMTLYGDLDTSIIDELPPGRTPVTTVHRFDSNRLRVFGFMKEQIKEGRQVYVVYPLIEESEKMDYKDLMDGFESISRAFPMPEYQVSIVHGRMKPEARDFEMQRFIKGETQIMVATTVIEVGVDVPNASVMVIESAERFGLSQLHQLRGRVGRGAKQSYCILMSSFKLSSDARTRIETMVRTTDGFEIAEIDMQLRGPGDLAGTQQSGILNLRLADITKDAIILNLARKAAQNILEQDPHLTSPENKCLADVLNKKRRTNTNWSKIS
ncbi:MAG: ATP-dependent DNA helicase RecG [Bacteroidota bacterium]